MLELKNIKVEIEGKEILTDVNAAAEPGELTLLMGNNGSGKTTLFNAVSNLLEIKNGNLFYNSLQISPASEKFNNIITFIRDDGATVPLLTVEEHLVLQCHLHDVNKTEIKNRVDSVTALLELEKYSSYRAEELSAGFRKKLGIAAGLVTNSEIFLLDEPFSSLDYKSTAVLKKVLSLLKEREKITIISTHTPSLLTDITDKIWFLEHGIIKEEKNKDKISMHLNRNSDDAVLELTGSLSWIK